MPGLNLSRRYRAIRVSRALGCCVLGIALLAPAEASTAGLRPSAGPRAPRERAQEPHATPPGLLFATSPFAVITATMTVTNTLDRRGVFDVEVEAADHGRMWPVRTGRPVAIEPGASARMPITAEVPIAAVDGESVAARLHVRAGADSGPRTRVEQQTLYAWTGGEMARIFRPNGRLANLHVGCRGDFDLDGTVEPDEVDRVAARFGARGPQAAYDAQLDFDHDGRIGAADVQAVMGRVGHRCGPPVEVDTSALRDAVTIEPMRRDLEALQAIAEANNGNRASGTSGYDASVDYMAQALEAVGYRDVRQGFTYPVGWVPPSAVIEQVAPESRVFVPGTDFLQAAFSAGGDLTAEVVPIDVLLPPPPESASTSGCEREDYEGFPLGAIALVQRGMCDLSLKVLYAMSFGASAVIIFNEGQSDRSDVFPITTLGPSVALIPVFSARFRLGESLVQQARAGQSVRLHIKADVAAIQQPADNVIAEWPSSEDNGVVMIGAHLDSVRSGPGINDDGSGVAAVVEIARQVARLNLRPKHRLRFGLFGAEEVAGWGSRIYVEALGPAERDKILAYLNFDMIASVNPMRDVYPGENMAHGSIEMSALFGRWFDARGVPYEQTFINGGLDSSNFNWWSIPNSGLFTGHFTKMSEAQAARYKGTPNAPMDPCYHRDCDTIANINWSMLDEMADAAAHAMWSLANDDLFPLTSRRALPLPTSAANGDVRAAASRPIAALLPRTLILPRLGDRPLADIAQAPAELIVRAVDVPSMAAFEVTLGYDPTEIEIVDVESGDFVPQGSRILGPMRTTGTVSFGSAAGAAASVTGTGRVAHIRFQRLRGPLSPRIRVDRGATGVFDAAGVRLPPPAGLRLEGATVAGAWLPVGFVGP